MTFSNRTSVAGFVLGLVGALLDFVSAYLIIAQSATMTQNGMGVMVAQYTNASAIIWGVGISVLGLVLIVTAIASISSIARNRMATFGRLMLTYGVVMLLVGGAMLSGITPMMEGSVALSSIGMFVIGALMIFNGVLMGRKSKMM